MVRRSFRFGLRLGLLGGIGFAIFKMLQARRPAAPSFSPQAAPWPPAPMPAPASTPASEPAWAPAPVAQEPVVEVPGAEAPPAPVAPVTPAAPEPRERPLVAKKAAPAKKATTKKAPAAKKAAAAPAAAAAWVEPSGGVCPASHPIKAKLASKIFHAPGQLAYDRTVPDRCYRDIVTATGDDLRPAKR